VNTAINQVDDQFAGERRPFVDSQLAGRTSRQWKTLAQIESCRAWDAIAGRGRDRVIRASRSHIDSQRASEGLRRPLGSAGDIFWRSPGSTTFPPGRRAPLSLQIRGSKTLSLPMASFPCSAAERCEAYSGSGELAPYSGHRSNIRCTSTGAGEGVHIPRVIRHWVQNGKQYHAWGNSGSSDVQSATPPVSRQTVGRARGNAPPVPGSSPLGISIKGVAPRCSGD